jgi:hypothetical protein
LYCFTLQLSHFEQIQLQTGAAFVVRPTLKPFRFAVPEGQHIAVYPPTYPQQVVVFYPQLISPSGPFGVEKVWLLK